MNGYERDKLQYLTSEEKERYFADKIRQLEKCDPHGILTHKDWFFRVVVLDFVVHEIQRLIYWFKNCSFDDFDTIYRIVRKLKLLHLDVEEVWNSDKFDVNRTNLFYLSNDDIRNFTKIDDLLVGNTLFDLFHKLVSIKFIPEKLVEKKPEVVVDKELVKEQKSELDYRQQRKVRQDVVARFWGSETELTKAAYDNVNKDVNSSEIKNLKN